MDKNYATEWILKKSHSVLLKLHFLFSVLHSRIVRPPKGSSSRVFIEVDHPDTDAHIRLANSIFETEEESGKLSKF